MVCYWTVNTSECVTQPLTSHSFLILWVLVTWTITHTHSHIHTNTCAETKTHTRTHKWCERKKQKQKWKNRIVAGGYSSIWRVYLLRLHIPAGKALKKNKHHWEKASNVLHWGRVQQFPVDSVLPQKAKEKYIYIQTRLWLVVRRSHWNISGFIASFPPFSSLTQASEPRFSPRSPRTCISKSHEAFFLCVHVDTSGVLTVSAGHIQGTLASHSESHCAGPKTCAGSEVRVLLMSCTGCTAQRSHNLRGSCWWRSASLHRPHCKGKDNGHSLFSILQAIKAFFWSLVFLTDSLTINI